MLITRLLLISMRDALSELGASVSCAYCTGNVMLACKNPIVAILVQEVDSRRQLAPLLLLLVSAAPVPEVFAY